MGAVGANVFPPIADCESHSGTGECADGIVDLDCGIVDRRGRCTEHPASSRNVRRRNWRLQIWSIRLDMARVARPSRGIGRLTRWREQSHETQGHDRVCCCCRGIGRWH